MDLVKIELAHLRSCILEKVKQIKVDSTERMSLNLNLTSTSPLESAKTSLKNSHASTSIRNNLNNNK